MGYSIIFDTRFIKASDGGYIEISRTGCNNDTEGRQLDEYRGTYYTAEQLNIRIASLRSTNTPSGEWDLRIGTRYATIAQYGDYLKRKASKAETWEAFKADNNFWGRLLEGVEADNGKRYTLAEFEKLPTEQRWYNHFRRLCRFISDYSEVEQLIKDGAPIEFYVKKKEA